MPVFIITKHVLSVPAAVGSPGLAPGWCLVSKLQTGVAFPAPFARPLRAAGRKGPESGFWGAAFLAQKPASPRREAGGAIYAVNRYVTKPDTKEEEKHG